MGAAQVLPDLTGYKEREAAKALDQAGFVFHHTTAGGYMKYLHDDGSQIWIRPNGEVIRLGVKVKGRGGKGYRPRFDQQGNRTDLHSTGEKLNL